MLFEEIEKVGVFGHDDGISGACGEYPSRAAGSVREHRRTRLRGSRSSMPQAPAADGCRARLSRGDDRMIEATTCQPQACGDVLELEVRKFGNDLGRRQTFGQQVENVGHANSQPPHAGASTALLGIHGNAVSQHAH